MDCLDDETLDALISGELSPAALERADAHIDDCADCRALVLELTAPQVPGVANSRMAPGASIGRFVVLEPLGAGGMGVVYAAYDPQLDRRVALKLVRTDTDHDPARARERLIREARAMAKLSHPNVVGVFDVGMVGQAVFVAMELVEGQNLRHWLAAKTRSWSELRQVYLQAAAGLSAAHAVGLVHRDFKPDNVIVGPEGRARVGDFGLARASTTAVTLESVPGPEGSSTMATTAAHSESSWAGTPAYMAPEVLAGKPADERSDQYSLCASLYEALAGTVPFPATSMAELMVRVQSGSIEPPKRRLGPGWLMAVAMRGLSRRPEDRFSTMQALARALRHDRRRRAVAGFGAGAVLLAGTTTGAFFVGQDRSPDAPAPCVHAQQALAEVWSDGDATALHTNFSRVSSVYGDATATSVERALDRWGERWTEAHRDTCEATHVRGEQSEALLDLRMACLRNRLGRVEALTQSFAEPDETIVEHAVEAVASLPTIAECSDARGLQAIEAPVDPAMAKAVEAEGPALAEVEAWVATGQFARAKAAIGSRVEAAVGLGHGPLLAEAQLLAARVETGTGDFVAARKAAYESLWAAQAARDDTGVARAWLALQGIAGQRGRWDEASHLGRHGEAAVSRLGMPKELEATLRNGLGVIYEQRGEYERARTELSRALELRRELYGEEHHEVARVLTNLGNLARSEGRKEALDFHRQALAIDLVVLGQGHPTVGRHHHNVARVLLLSGDAAGALENYEMALAIRTAAHGPKHVDVGRTHNSLGLLFARLDDPERATTHYRRALEIFEAGEHADQGLVLHNLGLLDARAGRHADAVEQQRRAREVLSRHVQGSSRPLVAAVLAMAEARVALGQTKAAAEDYASAEALATTLGDEALIARARQGAERLGDAAILVEPPKPEPTKPPKRRRKKRRDQGLEEPQGSYAAGRAFDGP